MSILDDIQTQQYGSWTKGESTLEELLTHMLNSLPKVTLASKYAYSTITFLVRPKSNDGQPAYSAWKIRYGNNWADFK